MKRLGVKDEACLLDYSVEAYQVKTELCLDKVLMRACPNKVYIRYPPALREMEGGLKKRYRNLAIFYVATYSAFYLFDYIRNAFSLSFALNSFPLIIAGSFALDAILFLLVYALSKSGRYWSPRLVGFRRAGILGAFVWANAFLLPITLTLLFRLYAYGQASILKLLYTSIPSSPPLWYPLYAIGFWIAGGIAVFPLLEAFPYESLKDVRKRYAIPLIVVLWAGIFNAPLLAGVINLRPSDIFFFDFLFLIAYIKSRNSIGLVLAYVLSEDPVWYIIAVSWGVRVLSMGIVIRALLSIACVGILVFQYWRSRENDQKFRAPHT